MIDKAKNTIFILSDELIIISLFENHLSEIGYTTRAFSKENPPREQILIKMQIDLINIIITKKSTVFLDYLKLFRQYKLFKNIPIMLISQHTLKDLYINHSLIDYYIAIPILPEKLFMKIHSILNI